MSDYTNEEMMSMHLWSHKKKMANNGKFFETMADHYRLAVGAGGPMGDKEKQKRFMMNYNLFVGRGKEAMSSFIGGHDEAYAIAQEAGIVAPFDAVPHHPVIDQIAKTMVGEQQRRQLKAVAVDSSGYTNNMLKKKRTELMQQYIQQNIINPLREDATMRYMREHNIKDLFSLSPEEQQQAAADINNRMNFKTPKEIQEFLRKDYRSPAETQAQKLTDYLVQELDVKFLTDEGFKHLLIAGEEVFYVGVRHNEPVLELINPMKFQYDSSSDSMFIEDSEWCTYQTGLKFSDVINRYGDELTESAIKNLAKMSGLGHGTSGRQTLDRIESELIGEVSMNPSRYTQGVVDIRNNAGQQEMKNIMIKAGNHKDLFDIDHTHVVFKSIRTLYYVERYDEKQDKKVGYWVDETYEKQPDDISMVKKFAPEICECTVLGATTDCEYVRKGTLPYQHRSLSNPWNVKLPYIGIQYNKLMGNVVPTSPIDNAKPWQYKFNVQMQKIHEAEATDIGKVAMIALSAKPKDWDFEKWLSYAKYGRILPIDTKQEGFDPYDLQAIRELDLTTVQELQARVQYLEFLRHQMILSMSYNPARLGESAAHAAVSNNRQDIVQSSFQTEDIFYLHSIVQRNILNALLNAARIAYKDNDFKRNYLLNDLSRAELELDTELLWRSELGIKIMNSSEEFNNIEMIKQLSHSMVQNGLITASDLIRIIWAKNGAEIFNIAEQAEEKQNAARQQAKEEQEALMQRQEEAEKKMMQFEAQIKMLMQDKEIIKDIQLADINSSRFAQQWDIDKNQLSDNIQLAREKAEADAKALDKQLKVEKEKHAKEMELKREELKIKKQEARQKAISKT